MEIERHLEKIQQYEDVISRLDPIEDFELWFWAHLNSATNALNAVLHHLKVTEPGPCFSHQIPGVFVEPEPVDGKWKKVIVAPGDIIHIGFPPLKQEVPASIDPFNHALEALEDFRETHVRGGETATEADIETCRSAYAECMAIAWNLMDKGAVKQ